MTAESIGHKPDPVRTWVGQFSINGFQVVGFFIQTIDAGTGRLRLFANEELSVNAALASACLPTRGVIIENTPVPKPAPTSTTVLPAPTSTVPARP